MLKVAVVLGVLALAPAGETEAWVFFSPDSPDASRLFTELRARGIRVRPVLLPERLLGTREPAAAFVATLAAAGEVRVVDPEGLREAERLGLRELPAVAVRRGSRVHLACGTQADIQEILRCSR